MRKFIYLIIFVFICASQATADNEPVLQAIENIKTQDCSGLVDTERLICEVEGARDLLRVLRNDQRAMLPTAGQSTSVTLDHEIFCARRFRKDALNGSDKIKFTKKFSNTDVSSAGWVEIGEFDVAYGENAYVFPVGKIKLESQGTPENPIGKLEFARKINGRIGAATINRGDVLRVNSPQSEIVTIMWRVRDIDHSDNTNVDLRFAYFVYGGIGTMHETNTAGSICSYY